MALAGRAVGVHLGAGDLDPRRVRAIVPSEFQIGVSVGDSAEAEAVSGANVDYWSVGSVYATATKRDAGDPIGPGGFRNLADLAPEGIYTKYFVVYLENGNSIRSKITGIVQLLFCETHHIL